MIQRAAINRAKPIKIEAKEPKFKLEGSSVVMYDGQLHVGTDIGLNIGTSYIYNIVTGEWKP